jgi:hypothetical protein
MPEIRAHHLRHPDAVAFVVGAARGVAIGEVGQVVSDHLLVVFEAAAGEHHGFACLHVNGDAALLGAHTEYLFGDAVLNQLPSG